MTRPRVLHCIYDDPANPWLGGGGAHRVREIYRRLSTDLDATVVAGAYPGARDGVRDGVDYRYVGMPRPYALSRLTYGLEATARLHRGGYDAAFFDFSVYTPIRVPGAGPVGHVVHMPIGVTAAERWGRLPGALVAARERQMLSRAHDVQTTSEWMARWLEPVTPSDARVRIVRSGVDDSFFSVERSEADHVLYYGRFDLYQKGLDLLLDAAPAILAARPSVRLVLAGRGKDEEVLRERIAGLEARDRVELRPGPDRGTVQELMAGALCLVLPSRFEGLPMVPAEAMAAGVPVVASDVGALSEIVAAPDAPPGEAGGMPPGAGILVPAEDRDGLAEAVCRLLSDSRLRGVLSGRARRSARRFSWDEVAAGHLAHTRDLVERASSR